MSEKTISYRVVDHCEDSYYQLTTNWNLDEEPEYIAQDAADDYFSNHGGWEASWPLTIALHDADDSPERIRMIVEMEVVPRFVANHVKT